jgi:hypothetical protein
VTRPEDDDLTMGGMAMDLSTAQTYNSWWQFRSDT